MTATGDTHGSGRMDTAMEETLREALIDCCRAGAPQDPIGVLTLICERVGWSLGDIEGEAAERDSARDGELLAQVFRRYHDQIAAMNGPLEP